jgi:WD40 repeat protein
VTIDRTHGGGEYFDHLAFSADGAAVIIVADTTETAHAHNVSFWDAATGRLERRHVLGPKRADERWHRTYAVGGDGRRVAAADWADSQLANVFDTADGRRVATVRGGGADVKAVALDLAGARIAVASWSVPAAGAPRADISVTEAGTGRAVRRLELPPDHFVTQVALSPGGRRLAGAVREWMQMGDSTTPADTTAVYLWDLDTAAEPVPVAARAAGPVTCVAFSPDGARVAFSGLDGAVRVHDALTGREACPPLAASAATTGLAFSPDGRRLAGVGMDGLVRLWDAVGGHELLTLRGLGPPGSGHYGFTARVAFSPDGSRLAFNEWDGTVTIWDAGPGRRSDDGQRPSR